MCSRSGSSFRSIGGLLSHFDPWSRATTTDRNLGKWALLPIEHKVHGTAELACAKKGTSCLGRSE